VLQTLSLQFQREGSKILLQELIQQASFSVELVVQRVVDEIGP
jgi:hypothetical protein